MGVKSNIRIKSNIYLRSPESCSNGDHPEADGAFSAQIFDASALKKLKKLADESGTQIAFSDIQKRILGGEINIRLADIAVSPTAEQSENLSDSAAEIPSVGAKSPVESAAAVQAEHSENKSDSAAEIPSVQPAEHSEQQTVSDNAALEKITFAELTERGFGDEKTAVVCGGGYAEYVSVLLHQNKIPHAVSGGVKPSECARYIADILWDCHDKVIVRDNFTKRFTARCGSHADRVDECFEALCGIAGSSPSDGMDISALAKSITENGSSDALFGVSDETVTVVQPDNVNGADHDKVYILENGFDGAISERFNSKTRERPVLLEIKGCPEIVRGGGRVLSVDSAGKASVFVNADDTDRLSFIGGSVGDAVRKQAYISQNVKCGDEIQLVLNGGVYDVVHNGMTIAKMSAEFSESIQSDFGGKRYFAELPDKLGGIMVTKVITVVSCRTPGEFGNTVPPQFRDRNFWLGVELSGFAGEIK